MSLDELSDLVGRELVSRDLVSWAAADDDDDWDEDEEED